MSSALAQAAPETEAPISTGNAELDKRIGGGLPRGSLTLVEGQSGAGKSVLMQHLCWGSLQVGETVSFYSTEGTVRSLLRQLESLGMDLTDYFLLGRLRLVPLHLSADTFLPVDALWAIHDHIKEFGGSVVLVDSLTSMLMKARDEEVLDFFALCKRMVDSGRTLVLSVHSYAVDERALVRLRSLCDAQLSLRTEQVGERLIKVLEVAKIRGANRTTGNIVSFDVEPGIGMRPIPVSRAKA